MARDFDSRKFSELILYVADKSEDDERFGATKLNKILYFSDFKAFGILGESITGATYVRLDRGPAPREMLAALSQMEREGEIKRVQRRYFNRRQNVVKPLQASDARKLLSDRELEIVEGVIRELRYLNASEVSVLSHLEGGWQVAGDREVIPYESAYISDREPTARELALWEQRIRERQSE